MLQCYDSNGKQRVYAESQVSTLDNVIQLHSNRISPQDVRCIDIVDESTNFAAAAIFFSLCPRHLSGFRRSTASASTVTKGKGKLHAAHNGTLNSLPHLHSLMWFVSRLAPSRYSLRLHFINGDILIIWHSAAGCWCCTSLVVAMVVVVAFREIDDDGGGGARKETAMRNFSPFHKFAARATRRQMANVNFLDYFHRKSFNGFACK